MFRSSLPGNPLALVALNRDVFFGIKLRNLAKELGYDLRLHPDAAGLAAGLEAGTDDVALIVVDMNVLREELDWDTIATVIARYPAIPSLGFGSHTDIEGRRAAKLAGLTRIVSNGDFHRNAGELIQRYALFDTEADLPAE